jgi:glycosyl transferase family 87
MVLDEKRSLLPKGCFHPVFLVPAALMALFLFRSVTQPPSDFAGYYFGGRELLHGRFGNAYDMEKLNLLIAHTGYRDVFVSYAPFPPFTALVFAPFLVFPMDTAKLVFDIFSCLLLLFTLMRARIFFHLLPLSMLLLPVVFLFPIVNNLFFGQSYLLLCCLLLEGFMAYRRKQLALSAILWGVAILFKIFPGILLIFLLLRKRYKEAVALILACFLLLTLSILINGWAVWKYYIFEILPKVNNGELNDSFAYLFQSAFMLLKRLFVSDTLLNPHPVTNAPLLFGILLGLFKATILTTAVMFTIRIGKIRIGKTRVGMSRVGKTHIGRAPAHSTNPGHELPPTQTDSGSPGNREFTAFSIWIIASMLISPNGSSYSLVLLIIPFLALLTRKNLFPVGQGAALLLLTAACFFPVYKLGGLPAWEQFPRLYLLLPFFGIIVSPWRLAWHSGLWTTLSVLFFLLFWIGHRPDTDKSTYLLTSEQHIFIDNFGVQNGRLVYSFMDGSGIHTVSTGIPMTTATNDSLTVKDEQIYYRGKQLTRSPDVKKKPLLIDGAYIVYLSDKNRGPGFYTLRKLPLSAR